MTGGSGLQVVNDGNDDDDGDGNTNNKNVANLQRYDDDQTVANIVRHVTWCMNFIFIFRIL